MSTPANASVGVSKGMTISLAVSVQNVRKVQSMIDEVLCTMCSEIVFVDAMSDECSSCGEVGFLWDIDLLNTTFTGTFE